MKLRVLVVSICLLPACADERPADVSQADGAVLPDAAPSPTEADGTVSPDATEPPDAPDAALPPDAAAPPSADAGRSDDTCAANGQYDFQLSGAGMSAWEGRRVMAAATENDNSTSPTTSQRVVLLSGTIQEGTFSLFCPGSLHENYAYPSWALFVDVDGNGKCSAGDVGYQAQLFGWNWDVEQALLAADSSAVTSLPAPIGSGASSFCSGYFE